ncbi:MAG: 5-formyltetrahydrofolate cyclo-ligase [Gallionellales bacterium GWA2_60_142]|nr:MAG: 5-formyltetrahydrofolate cyclo-ligase [Gallionellales bacterium GWA2_60_142]HCI13555.1 5-formyltetrahydrofolate cyclo-ligase [Gallionellaceae bacterium]
MPQALKQSIRKNILSQREQLLPEARATCSADIVERLLQLPECRDAGAVLGYMNFGSEFASELFAARALAEGKRLALPKVNHHTNQLDLYWVEDFENQLAPGLWGIREPVVERCERVGALNEVEFALLPGVAFTRGGARLGYGGGFYDKLLAGSGAGRERPVLVAAAFALQIVEQLPQEATDIKVERIVTEQEAITCTA